MARVLKGRMLGVPTGEMLLVLNKKELAVLESASKLCERLRDKIREHNPDVDYDCSDDTDMQLAEIEHTARELLDEHYNNDGLSMLWNEVV